MRRCTILSRYFALALFAAVNATVTTTIAQEPPPPFVVEDPPKTPDEQQKTFHLPEGFSIELVASEPAIINPINLNFDAAGGLLVSQSIEYPIPDPIDEPGRDRILRLTDSNDDGIPDETSTFADNLHIPIGVAEVSGGVLGFGIPRLNFFPQGEAGKSREVVFDGFGFDDTHGLVSSLTWWVDGWVYGCHGFVNTSEVKGSDGEEITMTSGNTYRLKADGSRIEHYSHGQVNPFGLCFDPWGNVFTSDCHTRPATMLLPGAHYPRSPGDGLGHGPELMQHAHGSTGIAGIVYYEADQFPKNYRGNLFIGNPITGRINQDRLDRTGSTYKAVELDDFLTCDDLWFRPVDIQLGPDGALYVADMYNCIIGHYEVPLIHPKRDRSHGRIWRISYTGTEGDSASSRIADLTQASRTKLLKSLGDANLTVRTQATHQLVDRIGSQAVQSVRRLLTGDSTEQQRAHGLWVLHRLDALTIDDCVRLLKDPSPLVRTHAVKAVNERREWDDTLRANVTQQLGDDSAFVRRAAVEAIAKHPHADAVGPLVRVLNAADPGDANLVHSARIALRNVLNLIDDFPALEERFTNSPDALGRIADAAVGVSSPGAAAFLRTRFQRREFPRERSREILKHVIRNASDESLDDILAEARDASQSPDADDADIQRLLADAILTGLQERGAKVPDETIVWANNLVRPLLTSDKPAEVSRGIALTQQMKLSGLAKELRPLCDRQSRFSAQRVPAIQALQAVDPPAALEFSWAVVADAEELPFLRQYAGQQLASLRDDASRQRVLMSLVTASDTLATGYARGLTTDPAGAEALLNLVDEGKVSARILQDNVVRVQMPDPLKPRARELTADLPSVSDQLMKTIAARQQSFRRSRPDAARGLEVFKKNCTACHRLDNEGNRVGPELDGVGQRGIGRLLEDILDPSRTVDKNYRATIIATEDGLVYTGLVTGQEGEVVLLVDQLGKQQRIPESEILERRVSSQSAMPANVVEQLPEKDLSDLLAFLLTKSVKPQQ